jgi:hypothetical protein
MLECKLSMSVNRVNDENKNKNDGNQTKRDGKQKKRSTAEGNQAMRGNKYHHKRNTNENNVERDTTRNREPRKAETLANNGK